MLKLRKALAMASVVVGVGAVAHADQFVLDVPFADLKKRQGEILLSDLRVGDAARIIARLCGDQEGFVSVFGHTTVESEFSDWQDILDIRMLPGREVDVTVEVRERDRRTTTPDARAIEILTRLESCDAYRLVKPATLSEDDFELLRVRKVNGHDRLSDLFE